LAARDPKSLIWKQKKGRSESTPPLSKRGLSKNHNKGKANVKIERDFVKTPVVNDIPDKTKVRPGDDAPPVLTIGYKSDF
jgi:hypothetical protein